MTTAEFLQKTARSSVVGPCVVDTFPDFASWDECQQMVIREEQILRKRLQQAEKEFAERVV